MSAFDAIFKASQAIYDQWNLTEIPFAESAEKLDRLSHRHGKNY